MIYLVTNSSMYTDTDKYQIISVEKSLELLNSLRIIGLDTETEGLDCHTKQLLSIQLGCYDFQVVIDCLTVDPKCYKDLLESKDHLFLGWNLKFDLTFLFEYQIVPRNCYDGFLAEKLLWLGYPSGMKVLSLKAAGEHYLDIELDKSVRGKIIYMGLTSEVIEYAADDVKYLEKIVLLQREELRKKDLLQAIEVENQFLLPLAYTEWCGVKLDVDKWKAKMEKDNQKEVAARKALDDWFLNEFTETNPQLPLLGSTNFVSTEVLDKIKELRKQYICVDMQGDLWNGFNTEPQVTLNWNSTKQVLPVLKLFNVDVLVKDKEKGGMKESLDSKVLKPQKNKCSIIPLYIEYGEAVKVTSTYGENFLEQINPATGRIHTSFHQLGADTTRITSGGVDKSTKKKYINLLNLPKDEETRECFTVEDGNRWISIDYSS